MKAVKFEVKCKKTGQVTRELFKFEADDYELALGHVHTLRNDPEFCAKHGRPILETCRVESLKPATVDVKPTWQFAMKVYIMALENGTREGKQAARDDLMELARSLDAKLQNGVSK